LFSILSRAFIILTKKQKICRRKFLKVFLGFKAVPHRHADRAPKGLLKRSLTCLSSASFQAPGKSAERRVSAFGGSIGAGVFFLILLLDKQKKNKKIN
jgi:hypothetical protein